MNFAIDDVVIYRNLGVCDRFIATVIAEPTPTGHLYQIFVEINGVKSTRVAIECELSPLSRLCDRLDVL